MKYESIEQSIQYKFKNEARYGKNGKMRIFTGVMRDADANSVQSVGQALANLQGDELDGSFLIDKQAIN